MSNPRVSSLICPFAGLRRLRGRCAAGARASRISSLTAPYLANPSRYGKWHGLCLFPEDRPVAAAGNPERNSSRWSLPCSHRHSPDVHFSRPAPPASPPPLCPSASPGRRPRSCSASSMSARATISAGTRRMPSRWTSLKAVPGVTVVEEENVPETDAVAKSMESMINLDGANLILATSFGYYNPFVVDLAKKYPDVQFRHAAPLWNKEATRRMPAAISAISTRRTTWTASPPACLDRPARSASSPPSRSRRCSPTSTRCCSARASVNPERHRAGDLHRRMVAAGARGRSHQRAGRCRLRRHHLPCRRPEGRDRDGRRRAA